MPTNKSVSSSKSRPNSGGSQIKSRPKSGGNLLFGNNSNTLNLMKLTNLMLVLFLLDDGREVSIKFNKQVTSKYFHTYGTVFKNIHSIVYSDNDVFITAKDALRNYTITFNVANIRTIKIVKDNSPTINN